MVVAQGVAEASENWQETFPAKTDPEEDVVDPPLFFFLKKN